MDIVVNYFGIAYGLQRPQGICVLAKAGEKFPDYQLERCWLQEGFAAIVLKINLKNGNLRGLKHLVGIEL